LYVHVLVRLNERPTDSREDYICTLPSIRLLASHDIAWFDVSMDEVVSSQML
jgi:hypothetical protein